MDRYSRQNLLLMFGIFGSLAILMIAFNIGNSLFPPPTVVNCQLSPEPNENGWYNSSVTATARMSGGSLCDWLAGKPPVYNAVTLGEGRHINLYIKADYGIASVNLIILGSFDIDYTPPATDITISRNNESCVTVTLTADDDITDFLYSHTISAHHIFTSSQVSGVKSITYQINGDNPITENGKNVSFIVTGISHIKFYATDYAGNAEEPQYDEILI